jgi:hypothetical protein
MRLAILLFLNTFFYPSGYPGIHSDTQPAKTTGNIILEDISENLQIRVEADSTNAFINKIGWDTEYTGKEKINLLKHPVQLSFLKNGVAAGYSASVHKKAFAVRYHYTFTNKQWVNWDIMVRNGKMQMTIEVSKEIHSVLDTIEMIFPFDPTIVVTSIISSEWEGKKFVTPAILSAPDIGQLLISCKQLPKLSGRMEGSRSKKWLSTILEITPDKAQTTIYTIDYTPVRLPMPEAFRDEGRWKAVRRGWFNMIQLSSGASGGDVNVTGVWANNALSDPVSSLVYMLGDAAQLVPILAPGVEMKNILRHTLEYWMYHKTNDEGLVTYTARGTPGREKQPPDSILEKINPGLNQNVMDANPAILIGAWSYAQLAKNTQWLSKNIDRLEFIAHYMILRDVDDDGLTESKQTGNSGSRMKYRNPDCAFDCYSSGFKNAYVNILVFRAWNAMADMETKIGRMQKAAFYKTRAERLRKVFFDTFYNPEAGWFGWWRSQDGVLHDVHSDLITSMAIVYKLVDIGIGRKMLSNYWSALQQTGFDRFDLGVPLNIKPVDREDMEHYTEFQQFLNGGATVSNASSTIDALYMVGMKAEADLILDKMLERQQHGVFSNGGGFQNGFVDRMGKGAEVFDWKGNPAGYEGHLVYCWSFLHSVLFTDTAFRKRRIFY